MPKSKTSFAAVDLGSDIKAREKDEDFVFKAATAAKRLVRPTGTKITKEEHRLLKQKECAIHIYV
jgi:hypothetical protein